MTTLTTDAIAALSERFLVEHPDSAARRLEEMGVQVASAYLSRIEAEKLEQVFEKLAADYAAQLLVTLDEAKQVDMLTVLDSRYSGSILAYLPGEQVDRLLEAAPRGVARSIRMMMSYEPNTAGSLMEPRVTVLRDSMTVEQARQRIAGGRRRAELRYFVSDEDGRPAFQLNARDLLIAEPETMLGEIARPSVVTATTEMPKDEILTIIRQTGQPVLPVVNARGRLVGTINHATLIGDLREEAVADIQKMVGVSKDERALSPAFFSVKRRLPWLEINLLTAFLAASVVGAFESTIAQFTALAVLLPVVAGQSGNAGAQALAVTIRGLALREIGPRQWLPIVIKEAKVGAINGIAVALTTGVAVLLWSGSPGLAAVISISMVLSMTIANVSGALTPIMLVKLGQDPAQSSSIVLTTITDVAGFMSFLGIATALSQFLPAG